MRDYLLHSNALLSKIYLQTLTFYRHVGLYTVILWRKLSWDSIRHSYDVIELLCNQTVIQWCLEWLSRAHARTTIGFYRATQVYASAVMGIVILSVLLSVTRVLFDERKEYTIDILIPYKRDIILVFWHQHWWGSDVPFHLKFVVSVTQPFEKRRLRLMSILYNVATVRTSEKV